MSELNYMQERLRQAVHSIRLVVPQSQWDDFIAEIAEIGVSVNWFMLDSTTIQSLIWNRIRGNAQRLRILFLITQAFVFRLSANHDDLEAVSTAAINFIRMSPGRSGFIHTDEDTKKKAEHGTRVRDEFRHEFWLITLIHIYNNIETVQEVRFENP